MVKAGCWAAGAAASLIAAACGQPDTEPPTERSATTAPDVASAVDDTLRERAKGIVAFLRGESPLEPGLLDDSVTLHVAPEGGGERSRISRETLQDRSEWRVGQYSFLPPQALTELTARVGRHFNCLEVELASLYPDLARQQHVGVLLEPPTRESCLQTWNMTLVFDGDGGKPRLTAVVYDQWEW